MAEKDFKGREIEKENKISILKKTNLTLLENLDIIRDERDTL